MCFIKIGDPFSPCDHEECKKTLEAFQSSNCMYNTASMVPKSSPSFINPNIKRPRSPNLNVEISHDVLKKLKFNKEDQYLQTETSENVANILGSSLGFQNQPINYMFQATNPQASYNLNTFFQIQKPPSVPMFQNFGNNSYNEALLNLQFRMKCNNGGSSMQTQMQESKNGQISEIDKYIFTTLINQNTLLIEMKEKSNSLSAFMEKLAQDFVELQKTVNVMKTEKISEFESKRQTETPSENSIISSAKYFVNSSEISKADELLQYLYLDKPKNFLYELTQGKAIELPLFRERNFTFSVILKDFNENEVFHTNRIPVSVAIYTYENPPKCIDSNTSGNRILKGYAEKDLVNGTCEFEKIQIKEVTSHFRKGKVFIVVYPKMPTFGNIPHGNTVNSFIEYTTIKPLIIENVVVKAKKLPSYIKNQQKKEHSEELMSEKNSIFEDI